MSNIEFLIIGEGFSNSNQFNQMSNIEFLRIWKGFLNSNEFKFLRSCELPPTTCRRDGPSITAASCHDVCHLPSLPLPFMIPLFHGALYWVHLLRYLLVDDEGFDAPILPFSETHSNWGRAQEKCGLNDGSSERKQPTLSLQYHHTIDRDSYYYCHPSDILSPDFTALSRELKRFACTTSSFLLFFVNPISLGQNRREGSEYWFWEGTHTPPPKKITWECCCRSNSICIQQSTGVSR